MVLAARCPGCKTVFRLVPDQLKLAGGWVRCGRCGEVFHGLDEAVAAAAPPAPAGSGDRVAGEVGPAETVGDPQTSHDSQAPPGALSPAPAESASAGAPPADAPLPPAAATALETADAAGWAGHADPDGPQPPSAPGEHGELQEPALPSWPTVESWQPADPPEIDAKVATVADTATAEPAASAEPEVRGLSDVPDGPAEPDRPAAGDEPREPASATAQIGSSETAEAADRTVADEPAAPAEPDPSVAPEALPEAGASLEPAEPDAPAPTEPPVAEASEPPALAPWPDLDLRADVEKLPSPAVPSFVAKARRAGPWEQPHIRATLMLLALVAAIVLVLQATSHYRERWIAAWPELRVWLGSGCVRSDCSLQPLRRIDALAVESSTLTEAGSPGIYRLSVSVRNRSDLTLVLPALDLSLTDVRGQLIARRVLSAAELGASASALAAGSELPLLALLGTGEYRVAGYSIELFYP